MWLVVAYRPTALFSLRSSLATSSGGRTLLVPTPYAVKLALVDAAFRSGEDGAQVFELVRDLDVRLEPALHAVVTSTFVKVQQEPKERREATFIPSIAYRELCFLGGELRIAFGAQQASAEAASIQRLAPAVGYLGKRGSFMQYAGSDWLDALQASFARPSDELAEGAPLELVLQQLDDLTPQATFEQVNTYVQRARGRRTPFRTRRAFALPYRLVGSSRGYTRYERSV